MSAKKRRGAPAGDADAVIYACRVEEPDAGRTLIDVLADHLAEQSLTAIRRAIRTGLVTVNERGGHPGDVLELGDAIVLRESGALATTDVPRKATPPELEVLYEDARCLVVSKPPGLPVLPTRADAEARFTEALIAHLRERSPFREAGGKVPRPRLVHRIDKDASGALIVAKDRQAMRELTAQFAAREIEKRYVALVGGEVAEDEGEIDAPILEVTNRRERAVVDESGKQSRTRFRVLERFRGFTWVSVRPETGRTHQIRVHMQHLGHPLAIDPLYGSDEPLYLSRLKPRYKRKKGAGERPFLARLPLHAAGCAFRPPGAPAGERVDVEAPLPDDLEVTLKIMRRHLVRGRLG